MAEGLAKNIFGDKAWIESAGSIPKKVNPFAIKAMQEVKIDITKHYSKSTDDISPKFIVGLQYVITLCAEEVCPVIVAQKAKKLHWPFPDPARNDLNDEEQLKLFRKVRDDIKSRLEVFAKEIEWK
jgi:arsenate reductase